MASAREPLLHAVLLLLARLFLVHLIGPYIVQLINVLRKSAPPTINPECRNEHGLKVIACGFSRSGTTSLRSALEHIGFGPCYHGKTLQDSPRDAELWLKAARGKVDEWSRILGGYKAIADFPAACFYRELMAEYPKAKVILNIRDPEQWYKSYRRTLYNLHRNIMMQMFCPDLCRLVAMLIYEDKFKGRLGDKEFAIGVYKQHIEEVKRVVPKEKLLVYKVEDGWIPLCNFLEVESPQGIPFPQLNESSSFVQNMHTHLMVYRLALAIYVLLVSVLVVAVLKCIRYITY